jgi:hypothetical protein
MRTFSLTVAIVLGTLMLSSVPSSLPSPVVAIGVATLNAHEVNMLQQQQPPPPQPQAPQINVEVKREGGRAWYMSPTWMAIGAIALVLLVLLVVMASRGSGGATIVKG